MSGGGGEKFSHRGITESVTVEVEALRGHLIPALVGEKFSHRGVTESVTVEVAALRGHLIQPGRY